MSHRAFRRILVAVALAVGVAAWSAAVMRAAPRSRDTVDDVVKAGQQGSLRLTRLLNDLTKQAGQGDASAKEKTSARIAGAKKIQPLLARLAHDRAFAKQVFDLSEKNDRQGLGALFGRELGVEVRIQEIKDFTLFTEFSLSGHTYHVCVSSDANCGGEDLDLEVS